MSFADKINSEFELAGKDDSMLSDIRKDAFKSFQKLGIPSNRHEEWRYTNIKTQLPETLSITGGKGWDLQNLDFNSFKAIKATKLVFLNGVFNAKLSTIIEETGITVGSLKEHFTTNKMLTAKHFN